MFAHRRYAYSRCSALSCWISCVSCLVLLAVCVSCAKQTKETSVTPAESSTTTTPDEPAALATSDTLTQPAPSEPATTTEPVEPAPTDPTPTEPGPAIEPSAATEGPTTEEATTAEPAAGTEPTTMEPPPATEPPVPTEGATTEEAETAEPPTPTEPAATQPPSAAEPPASSEPAPTEPATATDPATSDAAKTTEAEPSEQADRVLRHAVFFKFKDTSSEEDIQKIVDAFRELPSKIDSIVDFKWGKNIGPADLSDGLTHCFLLSFKDEAGREEYLPHDAHKAFGEMLGPHLDKAFVVDYWGTAEKQPLEKELKRAVFLKYKDDAPAEEVKAFEQACAALPSKIDTIKAFEWGTNNSPEKHDDGFTHCFMFTFASEEDLASFESNSDHAALVEMLEPLLDKARVFDFWVQK